MAKKVVKRIDSIEDSIIKDYGEVMKRAEFLSERRNKIINVSPNLDVALGGGIPEGSFVLIAGQHSLGKSSLALQIAANAQKLDSDFGRRDVYYFDIEGRLKDRDLDGQPQLDIGEGRFNIICSTEEKILSGDEFLEIGERLLHTKRGAVFIFDSFSAICTKGRMEARMGERYRDDAPLLLSMFTKRINQIIPVNKSIVIGINHIIANQGMGHKTTLEASGNKVQYQADVKLVGIYPEAWMLGSSDVQIGSKIHWKIEKTALGTPPSKMESWLRWGFGFDKYKEIIDLGIGCGYIKKKGAWLSFTDTEKFGDKSIQGLDNFRDMLYEEKELFDKVYKEIMDMYLSIPVDEINDSK